MARRYVVLAWVATVVVTLDQLTKFWVRQALPLGASRTVVEGFFDLVHVANRGAAFGFLNRQDIGWQNGLFLAVACLAVAVVIFLVRQAREDEKLHVLGLAAILAGAVGNAIDRLLQGYVTDFLDVYYGQWHWPAFNVADAAICVGAGLVLLTTFRKEIHASHSV